MSDRTQRIAIVGAGFTGAMVAVHLLRRLEGGVELLLFDRRGTFGRGLAYSARNPYHLLNVRVANMSAFEDDPQHFIRWLWQNDGLYGDAAGIPPSGHAFASRATYGAYVEDVLGSAIQQSGTRATITRVVNEAVGLGLEAGRPTLTLADGRTVAADRVVLCIGNFPPSPPAALDGLAGSERYIADPWDEVAVDRIGADDSVLIVGTGLTMVDVVSDLAARGHRGTIRALSRRGLLPNVHKETRPYPPFFDKADLPRTLLEQTRRIRREIVDAARRGFDWRSVMDAIRPIVQELWLALPMAERRRFLRHVRPYWDVHRHRMAPEVAREIESLRRSGRLVAAGGRITEASCTDGRLSILFRPRDRGPDQRLTADWMINCSGPESDYKRISHPLVRSLFDGGLARPDPLSLGLEVTRDFAVVERDGAASTWLFALGPPTKGAFWESTAVPDIRKQCARFAERLSRQDGNGA